MSPQVTFQPDGKRSTLAPATTILEACISSGIDVTSVCGGSGSCGKCKVIIRNMDCLNAPAEAEMKLLSKKELELGYRLACVTRIRGNVTVLIPDSSRKGRQRLQTEGIKTRIKLKPLVTKVSIKIPKPSLEDQGADAERLQSALKIQYNLDNLEIAYDSLKKLPIVLREGDWTIDVTLWDGRKIIDVGPHTTANGVYGLAVDIGTTKMAGYLMELKTGKLLSTVSLMNPQTPFGNDVISRIACIMKRPEALRELEDLLVTGVNQILNEACEKAAVSSNHVYETTIVGNTAMHHLLLGINPKFVTLSPYVPVIQNSVDIEASKLGIAAHSAGNVHLLPIVAGFVGADCIADILASEVYRSLKPSFMIDVGTNTEIVVGSREGLVACSCASGPAFEGAHIKYGMRAATGAIEKIWIDPNTLEPNYLVIDEDRPRGICGSAIVDVVAEMLKAGVMDTSGKILSGIDNPRVRQGPNGQEFVIAYQQETSIGEDIVVTQLDVREVQKAKAAIYTGASIAMKRAGVARENLEKVFIAGAFGTYVDPASAKAIGMYPDVSFEKIIQIGNAAGTGARMALLSKKARKTAWKIRNMVKYVELAADPDFREEYISALFFPHADLDQFPETMGALKKDGLHIASRHETLLSKLKKLRK